LIVLCGGDDRIAVEHEAERTNPKPERIRKPALSEAHSRETKQNNFTPAPDRRQMAL